MGGSAFCARQTPWALEGEGSFNMTSWAMRCQRISFGNGNGHGAPGAENLEKLAHALDATMEFLHGDDEYDFGNTDEGYAKSAAHMSFRIFLRDRAFNGAAARTLSPSPGHRGAPRTAAAWRDFAEMVELAIGPKPPQIGLVKKGQ